VANGGWSNHNVSVLLGNGDGSFAPETRYLVGLTPLSVAVGDFDGDDAPDLAVANSGGDVSVLLNQSPPPTGVLIQWNRCRALLGRFRCVSRFP